MDANLFYSIDKGFLGQGPWTIHHSSVVIRPPGGGVNVNVGPVKAQRGSLYCIWHVSIQHTNTCNRESSKFGMIIN